MKVEIGKESLTLHPHVITSEAGRYRLPVELGRLVVPENRVDPASRMIELAFARLPATAANPGPPVFFLEGGPGDSGIDELGWDDAIPWFLALRESCDVIFLDQRGTGLSRPNLNCPIPWDMPLERAVTREEWLEFARERSRACAAFWTERGVDLRGYTTIENADDIDALRQALGYEQISLWGASYGSHLALATIRRHGAHVARAVVALVEGPDHTWKLPSNIQRSLEHIAVLVRNDPALSAEIPDLLALMRSVIERLEREPVAVEGVDPRTGEPVTVVVGAFDLKKVTASWLGWREALRELPARYYAAARGDFRWLADAVLERRRGWLDNAMYWHMDCASGATAERLERIRCEAGETLLGDAIDFPFPGICDAWGKPDLGDDFRSGPLHSEVPVLFVSGTLDGRTPVSNVEELLPGFPNAHHLIIENGEHGYEDLIISPPEVAETLRAYLAGEPFEVGHPVVPFAFAPLSLTSNGE